MTRVTYNLSDGGISPAHGAVRISILRITSQNAGSEVSVRVVLENGEHREQKSLLLTMEQYCEIKPQKGEISEERINQSVLRILRIKIENGVIK